MNSHKIIVQLDPQAHEETVLLNKAYETLKNKERRARYDREHPLAGHWKGDSYKWNRKKQTKTNPKYDKNTDDELKGYAAYIWEFIVKYFNDFKWKEYTYLWFEKYLPYIWDIFIKGSQKMTNFGQYLYNEFMESSSYIWDSTDTYFDELTSWFEKYSPYIWDMQKMTNFGQFVYNNFTHCSTNIWNFIVQVAQFVWDITVQGAQKVAFRFHSGTYRNGFLIFFTKPLFYIFTSSEYFSISIENDCDS